MTRGRRLRRSVRERQGRFTVDFAACVRGAPAGELIRRKPKCLNYTGQIRKVVLSAPSNR